MRVTLCLDDDTIAVGRTGNSANERSVGAHLLRLVRVVATDMRRCWWRTAAGCCEESITGGLSSGGGRLKDVCLQLDDL